MSETTPLGLTERHLPLHPPRMRNWNRNWFHGMTKNLRTYRKHLNIQSIRSLYETVFITVDRQETLDYLFTCIRYVFLLKYVTCAYVICFLGNWRWNYVHAIVEPYIINGK
jgi:hypothetical protein